MATHNEREGERTREQERATIMVVDDAPANLTLLRDMLSAKGYRVVMFPGGTMALNAAAKNPPDLILLDIDMPDMDGFEVCERLKADDALKDIPVIFISAMSKTEDKIKAFSVGGIDYVTKPFQFEEVHARVETHLKIQSLQHRLSEENNILDRLVAERTEALAEAYIRVRSLSQIKDDFLRMISHELRTSANGVLGIGDMIVDLCPASEDRTLYADLFRQSSLRLRNLIDDAILIADMENSTEKNGVEMTYSVLFDEVRAALPDILISVGQTVSLPAAGIQLDKVFLKGDPTLLKRALETILLLAISFSRDKHAARMMLGEAGAQFLRVHLDVDDLSLSAGQAAEFFEIESTVRSASTAESLGLSPVVAHKIIRAFGGELRLVKGDGNTGYLEAILLVEAASLPLCIRR